VFVRRRQAAGRRGVEIWANVQLDPHTAAVLPDPARFLSWAPMSQILMTPKCGAKSMPALGQCQVLVCKISDWECLDHIIVFNESSLRHILKAYFEYYEHSRTHLALEKVAPESRAIQTREAGIVVELPQVGGLHHRYERRAA
jgi:hypothetical protein